MSEKKKDTAKNDTAFTESSKYKTCKHVICNGDYAVYVDTGCRNASMVKGTLVSSRMRCQKCKLWEGRDDA